MKSFIGFILKEFQHIFRDSKTLILLFGLPMVQILIFGFVIRNDIQDVRIAVLDNANDQASKEITAKILSSGFFILDEYLEHPEQIEKAFRKNKVKEVVLFEKDFAKKLKNEGRASMQIIADASDPNSASLVVNYTKGIVQSYLKQINNTSKIPYKIEPKVRMLYNEDLKSVFMFVPGTMAMILMLVSAMMTSISITREKEMGTMEVLLISPLKPIQIILGKVTPYLFLSLINAAVIILLGVYIFGLPIRGNFGLLFAESILFIFLALSLGIMISSFSKSQQVAMFISVLGLMLPTILLSGFIFPIENMPLALQYLAVIVPPKYFIEILKSIMLKGNGLEEVWQNSLILIGMTAVFLSLAALKFKVRLE